MGGGFFARARWLKPRLRECLLTALGCKYLPTRPPAETQARVPVPAVVGQMGLTCQMPAVARCSKRPQEPTKATQKERSRQVRRGPSLKVPHVVVVVVV